jgi:hypothetical protein
VEQVYRTISGLHTSRNSTGVVGYRCITGLQEYMYDTCVVLGCRSSTGALVYRDSTVLQQYK